MDFASILISIFPDQLAGTDGSARTSTSSSAFVTTSSFTTAPCSVYNAYELDPTSSDYVEPVYEWPTLEVRSKLEFCFR